MISEERLLKVLRRPHISEKTSTLLQKHNTIVFKVDKDATKLEIKTAVYNLLEVQVHSVHTMLIKGKKKRIKQRMIHQRNWKKAYITLQAGQKLDFLTDTE